MFSLFRFIFAVSILSAASATWAQSHFTVSDCSINGLIVENVGYMHSIDLSSSLDVRRGTSNDFFTTKKLSRDYKFRAFMSTSRQRLQIDIRVYKNDLLLRRKIAFANLSSQQRSTYYTSEIEFQSIYETHPALNNSDILSFKLRCLVSPQSYWFWLR